MSLSVSDYLLKVDVKIDEEKVLAMWKDCKARKLYVQKVLKLCEQSESDTDKLI